MPEGFMVYILYTLHPTRSTAWGMGRDRPGIGVPPGRRQKPRVLPNHREALCDLRALCVRFFYPHARQRGGGQRLGEALLPVRSRHVLRPIPQKIYAGLIAYSVLVNILGTEWAIKKLVSE